MKSVIINGNEYELQPFTAGQLRREASAKLAAIEDSSAAMRKGETTPIAAMPTLVGNCCDLVLLSLSNKYPDMTLEMVESLPFPEIQAAVEGVAEVTGFQGETTPQMTRSR